jgi:hypothetical protein
MFIEKTFAKIAKFILKDLLIETIGVVNIWWFQLLASIEYSSCQTLKSTVFRHIKYQV